MGTTATGNKSKTKPHRLPADPRYVAAGACVGLLFAIVLVVRLMQRPEPMDRAARTVFDAILAGDAKTLMRYVASEEREATGLDEASLQELLNRVVLPAFAGCRVKRVKEEDFDSDVARRMYYTLGGELECKDGGTLFLAVDFVVGDRPTSQQFVLSLVYQSLHAYGRKRYPDTDWDVLAYKAWKDLRPVFDSLQLQKVWVGGTLHMRAVSWDEFEDTLRRRAESSRS